MSWRVRTRAVVSTYAGAAAVLLLVLALTGGWLTYTAYAGPTETHTETRPVATWTESVSLSDSAVVRRPNPLYPVGETLSDREVYFSSVAPVLDATVAFRYAADRGNLTVRTNTEVVFQSVKRDRDGNITRVYWATERQVSEQRVDGVAPGERVTVPVSINVSRLANRTDVIEEDVGNTPGDPEALVRVTLAYDGTVDGRHVRRNRTYAVPVTVGTTYAVLGEHNTSDSHTFTRAVVVPDRPGPLQTIGGPVILLAALSVLGVLVAAYRTDRLEPTDAELAYAAYRSDRAEFEEWIHAVSLPDGVREFPRAEAASLADLVDLAIDTDSAVLDPPGDDAYYVVTDGFLYRYQPPTPGSAPSEDGNVRPAGAEDASEDDEQSEGADEPEE